MGLFQGALKVAGAEGSKPHRVAKASVFVEHFVDHVIVADAALEFLHYCRDVLVHHRLGIFLCLEGIDEGRVHFVPKERVPLGDDFIFLRELDEAFGIAPVPERFVRSQKRAFHAVFGHKNFGLRSQKLLRVFRKQVGDRRGKAKVNSAFFGRASDCLFSARRGAEA